jgi:hypothetical protein
MLRDARKVPAIKQKGWRVRYVPKLFGEAFVLWQHGMYVLGCACPENLLGPIQASQKGIYAWKPRMRVFFFEQRYKVAQLMRTGWVTRCHLL